MYASQKSGLDPIDWKSSFLSILYERVSLAYQLAGACGDLRMGRRMTVLREGGVWWELLVKFELIRLLPRLQLIIHWHNTGTLTWYNADSSQIQRALIDRMNRFEIIVRMAIWVGSILNVCFISVLRSERLRHLFVVLRLLSWFLDKKNRSSSKIYFEFIKHDVNFIEHDKLMLQY